MPLSRLRALNFLFLLFLSGCAAAGVGGEDCERESLLGTWKTSWMEEYWTFKPDGTLECIGQCFYGLGIGGPEGWADEPHANLWAGEYDFLKLIFSEKTFEGTLGSYRCLLLDEGRTLRLEPFKGPDLDLIRADGV